jgi:peptidoglycan hydrolase CwlO-like protein
MSEQKTGISKGSLLTAIVALVIFLGGLIAANWSSTSNRIRVLEIQVSALDIRLNEYEKYQAEIKNTLREIQDAVNRIDNKIIENEAFIKYNTKNFK